MEVREGSCDPRTPPEVQPISTCRILILGDGNFSFSLALAKALRQQRLVAASPSTQRTKGKSTNDTNDTLTRPKDANKAVSGTPINAAPLVNQSSGIDGDGSRTSERSQQLLFPSYCKYDIVATSFDGHKDLLEKYPEWIGIEPKLRALGVTLIHNVDATALDDRVLRQGASSLLCPGAQYDHVIFNHPHTGTEDMRRHRSFLGHFFHALVKPKADSCDSNSREGITSNYQQKVGVPGGREHEKSVSKYASRVVVDVEGGSETAGRIAPTALAPGGVVHVTLAGDQPERWGLCEQAARHGLSLAHRRPFCAERIGGYMSKRHQTGKSFQRRARDSDTLSFEWNGGDGYGRMAGRQGTPAGINHRGEVVNDGGVEAAKRDGGGGEHDGKNVAAGKKTRVSREEILLPKPSFVFGGERSLPPWLWPDVDMFRQGSVGRQNGAMNVGGTIAGREFIGNKSVGDVAETTTALTVAIGRTENARPNFSNLVSGRELRHGNRNITSTATSIDSNVTDGDIKARGNGKQDNCHDRPEICRLCGKRYKTAQGLRTHTRQLHELRQKEGGFGAPSNSEPLPCTHCGRVFTSEVALAQHASANHGTFNDIKPDWFEKTIYLDQSPLPQQNRDKEERNDSARSGDSGNGEGEGSSGGERGHDGLKGRMTAGDKAYASAKNAVSAARIENSDQRSLKEAETLTIMAGSQGRAERETTASKSSPLAASSGSVRAVHCDICGYWFAGEAQAQQHLDNLRPPIADKVVRHECLVCKKQFGSRRALLQHVNFCGNRNAPAENNASSLATAEDSSSAGKVPA